MDLKGKIQSIVTAKVAVAAAQAAEAAAVNALVVSADASDEALAPDDAVAFIPTNTVYANLGGELKTLNLRGITES